MQRLQGLLGEEGATAVQGLLKSARSPGSSVMASVVGAVTFLIGATSVFVELQSDLDRVWRAPVVPGRVLWTLIRSRLQSFALILLLGFLLLVSLVFSAALAGVGRRWGPLFGDWDAVLQSANLIVSFAIVTLLFALTYKVLPRARVAWRDVWIGAVVTALLFSIGKRAIELYLGTSGISSGFGAAGSIAALLVWIYYSSQIFLLGAEFTWVYAHRHGSHANGSRATDPMTPLRPANIR